MAVETLMICGLTAAISLALTAALVRWPERLAIWDVPNARSSHAAPKPRTGGIAIFAAWCVGLALSGAVRSPGSWTLFGGATAFFLLGLADDRWRLPEWSRLIAQVAISTGLAAAGLRFRTLEVPGLGATSLPIGLSGGITVFWMCGFVNLFNFMDGVDGIAACQAVIAAAFFSLLAPGSPTFVLAAAAIGFLGFNAPPSRIFMGDSGSYFLGSALAISAVQGAQRAPFPALVLVFGAFIADTMVTLIRRMLAGETWFKAHRSHFYQRLVALGWSHSRVTILYSMLSFALGLGAVAYSRSGAVAQIAILAGGIGLITALFAWITLRERAGRSTWKDYGDFGALCLMMALWGAHLAYPMNRLQFFRVTFLGYFVPLYYFLTVFIAALAATLTLAFKRQWAKWELLWLALPLICLPAIFHSADVAWSFRQWSSWIVRGVIPGGVVFFLAKRKKTISAVLCFIYPVIIAASILGLVEIFCHWNPLSDGLYKPVAETTQPSNPFYRPPQMMDLSGEPQGTQGNRIPYTSTLVGFFPLGLWLLKYKKRRSGITLLSVSLLAAILLLAPVRTAWIAFFTAVTLTGLMGLFQDRIQALKSLGSVTLLTAVCLAWPKRSYPLWERMLWDRWASFHLTSASIRTRLDVLRTAAILKDRFILGVGYGQFSTAGRAYYHGQLAWPGTPDNQYLRWAIENGIPGLVLLMAFFIGLIRAGWKQIGRMQDREQADFYKAVLIGWLSVAVTFACFDGFYWGACNMTFWCLLGLFATCLNPPGELNSARRREQRYSGATMI